MNPCLYLGSSNYSAATFFSGMKYSSSNMSPSASQRAEVFPGRFGTWLDARTDMRSLSPDANPMDRYTSHQIIYASGLIFPGSIFPRTADCRHEFDHGNSPAMRFNSSRYPNSPERLAPSKQYSLWLPSIGSPPDFLSRYDVRA